MVAPDPDLALPTASQHWRSRRRLGLAVAAGTAALGLGLVWAERIDIAHRLIDRQIQQLKLMARYRIDEIGPGREVLSDISLGNSASPDMTVKTLTIATGWQGGLPAITALKLDGVRLRGRFHHGRLSFGTLDAVIFAPTKTPLRLPDLALTLRDAALSIAVDTPAVVGPIGIAVSGDGNLRDGFRGLTAMVAPSLRLGHCVGHGADFHGQIAIDRERPQVSGPMRMAEFVCAGPALAIQAPRGQLTVRLASAFDGGTADLALATGAAGAGGMHAARLTGSGNASLSRGIWSGGFVTSAEQVQGRSFRATQLGIAGQLRAALATGAVQATGTLSGRDLSPDRQALAALAQAEQAGGGTFAAPLLAGLRRGIARETAGDRLSGSWILRRTADSASLILPGLSIDGARTAHWLSLSRVALQQVSSGAPAVTGQFGVAGAGFPQLRGAISALRDGAQAVTLTMSPWTAATTSLALPLLAVHWDRGGIAAFNGRMVLSGPVPNGQVAGLTLPLQGRWSARDSLLVGDRCTAVGFDRLTIGGLALGTDRAASAVTLCPGRSAGAIVALNGQGLRLSARTPALNLAGRLNGSDLNIATGVAALTWPGALSVADIAIALPGPAPGTQLHVARLTASLGNVIAGQFAGGDGGLAATPAVVRDAAGAFRWARGRLGVDGAAFRVEDPALHPSFAPIIAHDVTLVMADGSITGAAALRATAAPRELANVTVVHDLASGAGHADVAMPGLVFDNALQPRQLSLLAEGVIADAKGTLTGHGRFDWDHDRFTSSGRLATKAFDFAAAFGPVKGVSGEIVFTDLIGLVTAPGQKLTIATINPGIEVDDGTLTFALQPGHVLAVSGARWPFLDGQLTLKPTRLVLGATEVRHYVLRVDALNAAKFLARMDLSNLAATGTFDGDLPLVFDESGGRIQNGLLLSRPPGGTVSYVGALTYKDLSPMANYAFQALRALSYRQMRIGMDGALAGDIVTRVSMQGVGQGAGAKRNFITRQIARLPIQFNVKIVAPFMQLATSFRSLYDPAMVADPRALGLIDAQGRAVAHPAPDHLPAAKTPSAAIQP